MKENGLAECVARMGETESAYMLWSEHLKGRGRDHVEDRAVDRKILDWSSQGQVVPGSNEVPHHEDVSCT
jgi:hypothetical protein